MLVNQPLVNSAVRNRDGLTPAEVACDRLSTKGDCAAVKTRIVDLLEGQIIVFHAGFDVSTLM